MEKWPNVPNHQPDSHWMIVLCMQHVFWTQWWIQHFFLLRMDDWSLSMFIQHIGDKRHWRLGSFTSKHRFFAGSPDQKSGQRKAWGLISKHQGFSWNFTIQSVQVPFKALQQRNSRNHGGLITSRETNFEMYIVLKTQTANNWNIFNSQKLPTED